jgi:hypothetical protein
MITVTIASVLCIGVFVVISWIVTNNAIRKAVDVALCNIEALHRCLNSTEKRIGLAA